MAPRGNPPSALPTAGARLLAFGAILLAGACGGLIGRGIVLASCRAHCAWPAGLGALVGAAAAAGGVAVIAVLVLRAMGEWRLRSAEPDAWRPPPPEPGRWRPPPSAEED
jgi:hypothetical protein